MAKEKDSEDLVEQAVLDVKKLEDMAVDTASELLVSGIAPKLTDLLKDTIEESDDVDPDVDAIEEGEVPPQFKKHQFPKDKDGDGKTGEEEEEDDDDDKKKKGKADKVEVKDSSDVSEDDMLELDLGEEDDEDEEEDDEKKDDDEGGDGDDDVTINIDADGDDDDDEGGEEDGGGDPPTGDDLPPADDDDDEKKDDDELEVDTSVFDDTEVDDEKDGEDVAGDLDIDGEESPDDEEEVEEITDANDCIEGELYQRTTGGFRKATPESFERGRIGTLRKELSKAKQAVDFYESQLDEANLFNARLAHFVPFLLEGGLSKEQRFEIADRFEQAKTLDEVKAVRKAILSEKKKKTTEKDGGSGGTILEAIHEHVSSKRKTGPSRVVSIYRSPEVERMLRNAGLTEDQIDERLAKP